MNVLYPADAEWALVTLLATKPVGEYRDALQEITPDDFSQVGAGQAFAAIMAIFGRHERPDMMGVDAELTRIYGEETCRSVMRKIIGTAGKTLAANTFIPRYVSEIADSARRRKLFALADDLRKAAEDGTADVQAAIDAARCTLRDTVHDDGMWVSGTDAAMAAMEAAESREKPIPTGFPELDKVLCGGLLRPEMTIVGARPGKGKSAFLLAAAMNAAKAGRHVCYFSLEMSAVQIGQRALATASSVSVSKQRYGIDMLTDDDWKALADGLELLSDNGQREFLHLYTGHGVTIEKLTSLAQNAMDRGELELLIIDYIQLLKTMQRTNTDFERLSMVSKGLKELALTLDVPILTAAQVRRQSNGGGASRAPGLDELRGSGDLEQDADNVLLIHSPDTPDDETLKRLPDEHAGIFERAMQRGMKPFSIDVAKQRQGALRRTWCLFMPKTMTFYEDS